MRILRFKTNIESNQSVACISNFIDRMNGVKNWEVDLKSPDKVLTIRGTMQRSTSMVRKASNAGYQLTPMS